MWTVTVTDVLPSGDQLRVRLTFTEGAFSYDYDALFWPNTTKAAALVVLRDLKASVIEVLDRVKIARPALMGEVI